MDPDSDPQHCLIVDQIDDGVLQHLRRLGQPLNGCRLGRIHLRRRNLQPFVERFRKHRCAHSLTPRLIQLRVHLVHLVLSVGALAEGLLASMIEVKEYTAVAARGVHILVDVAAGEGGGLGLVMSKQ